MSIDYTALKAELDAGHPVTGAYDADDQAAADELNLANIEVDKLTTSREAQDATNGTEFNALSEANQNLWVTVLGWGDINLNAGIGLETATGIWAGAAGTVTRPALIATRKEMVNRTSQLGFGRTELAASHVAYARTL